MAVTPNLNLPLITSNMTADVPRDMNALANAVDEAVMEAINEVDIPLSDATNGSRSDVAASEKAVGLVMQEAQAGKQAGIDRKAEVVAALNSIGVPATTSETWAQLIPKMASIIRATGNAVAADLLAGKTASNPSGQFTGTMPDRGAATITPSGTGAVTIPDGAYKGAKVAQVSVPAAKVLNDTTIAGVKGTMANQGAVTITPGAANKAIPAGYHSGGGIVAGDPDLVPNNIRAGIDIFGVLGTLAPMAYPVENFMGFGAGSWDVMGIINSNELVTKNTTSGNHLRWYDKNCTLLSELTWAQLLKSPRAYYNDNDILCCYKNTSLTISVINRAGTVLKSVNMTMSAQTFLFGAADANYYYVVTDYNEFLIIDKNLNIISNTKNVFGRYTDPTTGSQGQIGVGSCGKVKGNIIYASKKGATYENPAVYIFDVPTLTGKLINIDPTFLMF